MNLDRSSMAETKTFKIKDHFLRSTKFGWLEWTIRIIEASGNELELACKACQNIKIATKKNDSLAIVKNTWFWFEWIILNWSVK